MSDDRWKDQPPPPPRPYPRRPYYVTADEIDKFNKQFAPTRKKLVEPVKRDEPLPDWQFGTEGSQ